MSPSRHKACNLCRDRKVRCDGNQPVCDKCRRQGETCVYSPTYKPTKAELAQTVENLRDRIDSAESYFVKQRSYGPPSSREPQRSIAAQSINTAHMDGAPYSAPIPSPAGTLGQFSFLNRNGKSIDALPSLDIDYFNTAPATAGNDLSDFRVDNLTLPDDLTTEGFHIRRAGGANIPSLREIRALNSISVSSSCSNPTEICEQGNGNSSTQQVLAQLQAFSSTIFITQAEIAGISSAVAEYLAWLKKVPGLPKVPTDSTALLETLEARVREMQEMAEEKHWQAWKMMLEKLDDTSTGGGYAHLLSECEAEMRKRTAEVAQDFHASYDVGKAMQEQINDDME
ncbi:MAG: hypothetical protein Q9171_003561 [Xanthocarpia ochracea]